MFQILFAQDTFAFWGGGDELDKNQALVWIIKIAQHWQSLLYVRIKEETGPSPSMRVSRAARLHDAPSEVEDAFQAADTDIELYLRPLS